MKYVIIKYKRFTQESWDAEPVIEDAEARLPIVRRDGDVFLCTYPDGRMHAFQLRQIEAFYDSESDLMIACKDVEAIRNWE